MRQPTMEIKICRPWWVLAVQHLPSGACSGKEIDRRRAAIKPDGRELLEDLRARR